MSNIKINDVFQRIQYAATAGQTQFAIPFPFFNNAYVAVWQNGVQLNLGASAGEYGITGAGSPSGGQITLVTAATLDDVITIIGIMPIDRTSIYSATISNLTGSDLNGDFNREVVMMKQIQTTQALLQLQYAPWAEVSQDEDVTKDRYIPQLDAQQIWRMNEAGTAIEPFTLDNVPAPTNSFFVTYGADPALENEQNLALLGSGLLKQTVAAGLATLAIAIEGTDYWKPGDLLTRSQPPSTNEDVTNKEYVDSIASGFTFVSAVNAASTANFAATYDNGASGVGATLTATANGAFTLDGQAGVLTNRYLMKDQITTAQNGVYTLIQLGDGVSPAILMRATDFDSTSEIKPGNLIPVLAGTANINTIWVQTATVVTIGTDTITFVKFSISPNDIVTLSTNQTITGQKTFNALTTINNLFFSGNAIQHLVDLDNQILFGTDTQSYETGGVSRFDINNLGFRLGGSGARVTTILTDDTMAGADDTNLYTGLAIKTYVGTAPGRIVQQIVTTSTTGVSTTTIIPVDDTIPQITEGSEYFTALITPTSTTNRLIVEVFVPVISISGAIPFIGALFKDATANALAVAFGGTSASLIYLSYSMTAGSISPATFRFRYGPGSAGTAYCNRGAGGHLFSSASVATIRITEIAL